MLEGADLEAANSACAVIPEYRIGPVGPGPFERMQFLRGTERLLVDLAEQPREFFRLLDVVHEFAARHVAHWSRTHVDAISMGDDWGSQISLLISPDVWRRIFRPLYGEYAEVVHSAGKRFFFHSDGMIRQIIPDLIDIGVDALNCQLSCMNIEELGTEFSGKVTFWGEVDRQHALPFGSVDDVRTVVRRIRSALDSGRGGLIAQLSWGIEDPTENIVAAFEAWEE